MSYLQVWGSFCAKISKILLLIVMLIIVGYRFSLGVCTSTFSGTKGNMLFPSFSKIQMLSHFMMFVSLFDPLIWSFFYFNKVTLSCAHAIFEMGGGGWVSFGFGFCLLPLVIEPIEPEKNLKKMRQKPNAPKNT